MYERWARVGYAAAWWLLTPLVMFYLLWRGVRQPEYRRHWAERFLGTGPRPSVDVKRVIWVHAVSVGEARAAQPLIEALITQLPDTFFVLTHMTPTGRAVGHELVQRHPDRIVVRYLPYEYGFALKRFLSETSPCLGVLMETEVWPGLLFAAEQARVPMVLANARLSAGSLLRALRFKTLMKSAANRLKRILAQTPADAARLGVLYAGPIDVVGNVKFDLTPQPALIERGKALRRARPSILLASSRDGEEAQFLNAWGNQKLIPDPNYFDVWVVPRHPQRFDEVEKLCIKQGVLPVRRSALEQRGPEKHFFLGDSMGEMPMYYALADITLMGGSFGPYGAQNLIESCAVGTPVIVGPSTYNFAQVVRDAVDEGAAVQVADMDEALAMAVALLRDRDRLDAMQKAALSFARAHMGATAKTVALLVDCMADTQ